LSEKFLILREIQRDAVIYVHGLWTCHKTDYVMMMMMIIMMMKIIMMMMMIMMIFVCVFVCEYKAYLMSYLYVKKNIWSEIRRWRMEK
jgi:hypothetical protein